MIGEERLAVIEKLRTLAAQGISSKHAALLIPGMTKSAVLGLAHRQNIKFGGFSYERSKSAEKAKVPKRSPKRVYLKAPPQEAPTLGKYTINDLTSSVCRFIFGDPLSDDHRYCGHSVVKGYSWCAFHCKAIFAQDDTDHEKPFKPFRAQRSY